MKRLGSLALVAAAVFISVVASRADYLEVRHSATLKQDPNGSAPIAAHVDVGANLKLLDNGAETGGYYRVSSPETQDPLWIYHTLVLRHEGDVPGQGTGGGTVAASQPLSGATMKAHFINMGQGNSTLLEFSCGAILIDAGGESQDTTKRLIDYLNAFFARRSDLHKTIDTIFVTHTHIDHNLALRAVVENFAVHHYVHNGVLDGSGRTNANWMVSNATTGGRNVGLEAVTEADVERGSPSAGLTDEAISPLHCAGVSPSLHVVNGPYAEDPGWPSGAFEDGNNKSIVIRVDFGESSFLFPGDLEQDAIGSMAEHYKGASALDVDVLEVGHHGSYNGTTQDELAAITPKIAVISMGDLTSHKAFTAYSYGHPRKVAVDLLLQWIHDPRVKAKSVPVAVGAKDFVNYDMKQAIYATGWDGTVDITADANRGYSVQTEH
jgi:beta-lactamase superfamily II metal-dependent hydrolase